jgi:hypothetical protein
MYRAAEFKSYFVGTVGAAPNTYNTYNSFLSRIDKAIGGLDEAIKRDGTDAILEWGRNYKEAPFDVYPSHARSVLKRYIQFSIEAENPTEDAEEQVLDQPLEPTGLAFRIEKEMQAAVRKQLSNIEPGLLEADGGTEVSTSTGRLDILAKDARGGHVVIELKAGVCPPGAIEQVLGYAQSIEEERGGKARALLIAADFPDRMRAAAKRIPSVQLLTYEFALKFEKVQ